MRMRDGFLLEVIFYDVIRTNRLLKMDFSQGFILWSRFFFFIIKCHLSACWKLIEDGSVFVFFFPFSVWRGDAVCLGWLTRKEG